MLPTRVFVQFEDRAVDSSRKVEVRHFTHIATSKDQWERERTDCKKRVRNGNLRILALPVFVNGVAICRILDVL